VTVDEVLGALEEQHRELAALLAGRSEAEWRRPSRCPGWDAADVVLHLCQTDRLAIASVDGTFGAHLDELGRAAARSGGGVDADGVAAGTGGASPVDAGAAWQVAQERGEPGAVIAARWEESSTALRGVLAAADPSARVEWVAGRLSVHTLATTRLAECWIHTGDVADAFGESLAATDRLRHVARLAWRTLPYAFARAGRAAPGPVGFSLVGPDGDPWVFGLDGDAAPPTVVSGDAVELCLVAARRLEPSESSLVARGPDAAAVLELVRTYA
jgi:uncharacterized protein (TIGR03084 family)